MVLVGNVQHKGLGPGAVADDGLEAVVGVVFLPHAPDFQLFHAAHAVDVQKGYQRGNGGVLGHIAHAHGRHAPGEGLDQAAIRVFKVDLARVALAGVQIAVSALHVQHDVALLGQLRHRRAEHHQRHAGAVGEQLAHDRLVLKDAVVRAEDHVMRQRRGVLVALLVVGIGILGGVALADGKHLVQMGDDVVDVVRRIGHHAQLAILAGEHMRQPARPLPLGSAAFLGEYGNVYVVIAVQSGDLHQQALGKEDGAHAAKHADDRLVAQRQRDRGVDHHRIGGLEAIRLLAEGIVDDGQLLLGNGNLAGQVHIARAHADAEEVRVGGHAVPQGIGALFRHLGALRRVGEGLLEPLKFFLVHAAKFGFHFFDVLAVALQARAFGDALLLFAVAAVDEAPHHRQRGGGRDHHHAAGEQIAAAAGDHGAHQHWQDHRHRGAELQKQRQLLLVLLGDGRLDLRILRLALDQHARRALVFQIDAGRLAVVSLRGALLRGGPPWLQVEPVFDAQGAVDGDAVAQIDDFQPRGKGQHVADAQPRGVAQELAAVDIGAVVGIVAVLYGAILRHAQRAVFSAHQRAVIADIDALAAPDDHRALRDAILFKGQILALAALDDGLELAAIDAVAHAQQRVALDFALPVRAVAPRQRRPGAQIDAAFQRAGGDVDVAFPAGLVLAEHDGAHPALLIGKVHVLEGVAKGQPCKIHAVSSSVRALRPGSEIGVFHFKFAVGDADAVALNEPAALARGQALAV